LLTQWVGYQGSRENIYSREWNKHTAYVHSFLDFFPAVCSYSTVRLSNLISCCLNWKVVRIICDSFYYNGWYYGTFSLCVLSILINLPTCAFIIYSKIFPPIHLSENLPNVCLRSSWYDNSRPYVYSRAKSRWIDTRTGTLIQMCRVNQLLNHLW